MGLWLALILCIALSAFFSATETAYSACNRVKLKTADARKEKAQIALALLEKYASVFGKGTKYHYYSNFFQKFTCITIAAKRIFIQKSKSNFNRQFYKLSLYDHSYNVKYR